MITFKDGTTVRTDMCIEVAGRLMFTVYGLTMTGVVDLIDTPENVREITTESGIFKGYTEPLCISKEGDHMRVTLGKAEG